MKINFIDPKGNLPTDMIALGYSPQVELNLSEDDIYTVYGIILWKGVVHYLIIPTVERLPSWFPASLFQITDHKLPASWYFQYFHESDETDLKLVSGYKEMVFEASHYDSLLEREESTIRTFLLRKISIDEDS